jgi:hypothetical protein
MHRDELLHAISNCSPPGGRELNSNAFENWRTGRLREKQRYLRYVIETAE